MNITEKLLIDKANTLRVRLKVRSGSEKLYLDLANLFSVSPVTRLRRNLDLPHFEDLANLFLPFI